MTPDSPPNEATPTSGSEILVPTPVTEADPATELQPMLAPETAPELNPAEIEATPPQVSFETETQPENPALALTFTPAPDAPFQSSVTVGIACQMPGAQIYYTLDGNAPDENSTAYTPEKILLTDNTALKARAVAAGQHGPICSADYVVQQTVVAGKRTRRFDRPDAS